jgi:hypothetical protein
LRFGVCFSIAIIGACPNENFVSRDLAISDYSDRLLGCDPGGRTAREAKERRFLRVRPELGGIPQPPTHPPARREEAYKLRQQLSEPRVE